MLQTRHNKALACLEQNARVLRDAVASHATEADKASSSGGGRQSGVGDKANRCERIGTTP